MPFNTLRLFTNTEGKNRRNAQRFCFISRKKKQIESLNRQSWLRYTFSISSRRKW